MAVGLALGLGACGIDYPSGVFTCAADDDCPGELTCRADGLCYAEGDGDGGGDGGGAPDGSAGCTPDSCPVEQMCVEGRCVVPTTDDDGDGVLIGADCDDTDPAVGSAASRECSSDCGSGVERCVMGEWMPCDAPSECDCQPGETRQADCAFCGTQNQVCDEEGRWVDDGACEAPGECAPGSVEEGGPCGERCGVLTRFCSEACTWGEMTCASEGVCREGETETEARSCGACGEEELRTRRCDSTCAWESWGDWGACQGGIGCTPGATESRTTSTSCGRCGNQQQERTCSSSCEWGAWTNTGCTGQGPCSPGDSDERFVPCPTGTQSRRQTRSCTSSCSWGAWGSLMGVCSGPSPP